METKQCTSCGEDKPLTEYHWHYKDKDIRRHVCKVCRCAKERQLNAGADRQVQRKNYLLQKTYGLTHDQFMSKLESQKYSCAICGTSWDGGRHFHVDHNHITGEVRDILCGSCNPGLGNFKDSPELLIKAAEYLRKHHG